MQILKKLDRRWWWIILGATAILIRYLLGFSPQLIEQVYSRGLFQVIRRILDWTIGLLPFSSLYLLIALLLWLIGRGIFRFFRSALPLWRRLLDSLFSLIAFFSLIIFLFLFLWGINYGKVPVERQLQLSVAPLRLEELQSELAFSLSEAMKYRQQLSPDTTQAISFAVKNSEMGPLIRQAVQKSLEQEGFPNGGLPPLRMLYPQGSLLVINTAGFYMPLTGECHVDPGLHPIQLPFVIAHEYHHAYGFTDEGSCNFMAYLAGLQSDDPRVLYSTHVSYWRYLASNFRRGWPDQYKEYYQSLPKALRLDLRAIDEQMDRFPELFPKLRYAAYDTYLKSQGISEGMKSYSRVVLLVNAWRKAQREQ
ncbi:MAG: DUF3810 domain-containing protein [Bacteroidota bacterium]